MTALPGAPYIAWRGNQLFIEDLGLDALARQHGTPLYVYSRNAMLGALAAYQRALKGRSHLVCYAMKANSSLAVLQTFVEAGAGFTDTSAWYWAALLGQSQGPWQAITVASPL